MKLIKRRTEIVYKEPTEQQWQDAYVRYLEAQLITAKGDQQKMERHVSFHSFRTYSHPTWHPILEVDKHIETEEEFVKRVTSAEAKSNYNQLQFVADAFGQIVSCVLF